MSFSTLLYIISAICFFLACIDFPLSGKMVAVGLFFMALGHCLAGVSFKAG